MNYLIRLSETANDVLEKRARQERRTPSDEIAVILERILSENNPLLLGTTGFIEVEM